jgi:hypothetical protein
VSYDFNNLHFTVHFILMSFPEIAVSEEKFVVLDCRRKRLHGEGAAKALAIAAGVTCRIV